MTGYTVCFIIAAFVYLVGYDLVANTFAGGYNAICATYPIITFILSYLFLNQRQFGNPYLVGFGLGFTVLGVALLAYAIST